MDTTRVKYSINPETGRKIKVGTLTWKRLVAKYYIIDGTFTDQVNNDLRSLMVKDGKTHKARKTNKLVIDPAGIKWYIVVGRKARNERYLEYEWNGHEFGEKRKQLLSKFMNTVEKRQ